MTSTINLDSKDLKKIISLFLGIPEGSVIPNRYSFGVTGISQKEIEEKLNQKQNA